VLLFSDHDAPCHEFKFVPVVLLMTPRHDGLIANTVAGVAGARRDEDEFKIPQWCFHRGTVHATWPRRRFAYTPHQGVV
jgi:hypothetical protein